MGIEDILKDYGDDLSGLSFDAQPKLKSADAPIVRNTPAPDNLMSPEKMLEEKFAPKSSLSHKVALFFIKSITPFKFDSLPHGN